jgi:hypothetical protein
MPSEYRKQDLVSGLSPLAQDGVKRFCSDHDLREVFESAKHGLEHAAYLWFLLRQAEDNIQYFPRGKWATLQTLEGLLDNDAMWEVKSDPRVGADKVRHSGDSG